MIYGKFEWTHEINPLSSYLFDKSQQGHAMNKY